MKASRIFLISVLLYGVSIAIQASDVVLSTMFASLFGVTQTHSVANFSLTTPPVLIDFASDGTALLLTVALLAVYLLAWKLDPIRGRGRRYRWMSMFLFIPAVLANVLDAALSALPALGTAHVAYWHPDAAGDVVAVLALLLGWLLAEVWFVHVTGGVSNGFGYTDIVARNPTLRRVNRILNVVVPLGVFAVFWVITYVLTYNILNTPASVLATESVAGVDAKTLFFVIWYPFVILYSVLAIRDTYMSAKGAWEDTRKASVPQLVQVEVLNGRLAYPTPPTARKVPAASVSPSAPAAAKPLANAPSKPDASGK